MDLREKYNRKNSRRKERTLEIRKEAVISIYVRAKHGAIYAEANDFYQQLNLKYPLKKDLRKTWEVKDLKLKEKADPPPETVRFRFGQRIIFKDTNMQLRIPLLSTTAGIQKEKGTTTTETIHEATPIEEVTTERIPLLSTTNGIQKEKGTTTTETIHEATPIEEVTTERIPLLSTTNGIQKEKGTTTTETIHEATPIEEVTTEIIEEGIANTERACLTDEIGDTIEPIVFDDLDPDLIRQIIDELREDPGLHDIMKDIEQEIECEEMDIDMDIDIEIPEDTIEW